MVEARATCPNGGHSVSKTGKVWAREGIERYAVRLEMDEHTTEKEFDSVREVLAALEDHGCDAVIWTDDGWRPYDRQS